MRLYVVRHGQTAWNVEGRAQGHTDISLDAQGLEQARAVGERFRGVHLDRIFTSDLTRAVQTAGPIAEATGAPLALRRELRERCFGAWEGTDYRDLWSRTAEVADKEGVTLLEARPPGGESFADLWERVQTFTSELDASEETVAVVTHGGAASVLLAQLFRGSLESSRSFRFGNTSVTEIERRDERYYTLIRYNDTSHLDILTGVVAAASGGR